MRFHILCSIGRGAAIAAFSLLAFVVVSPPAKAADSDVSTIDELSDAMDPLNCENGDTITLIADISDPLHTLSTGCANLTLDLNGHDLEVLSVYFPLWEGGYTLTITDAAGGGTLTADASGMIGVFAGIQMLTSGIPHTLNVFGGTITARGSDTGAGIGGTAGHSGGIINVHGGTVNAYAGNNSDCAGIGGENMGDGGTVTVYAGSVNAFGGGDASGIGGGANGDGGTVAIHGGNVNAHGGINGSGIGGGYAGSGGDVTITGGVVVAVGGTQASGIGGGHVGTSGTITISGGEVVAVGGGQAAGIGSGDFGAVDTITISGGSVSATGGVNGAGIGSGSLGEGGLISISGGTVEAIGGDHGAAIGGGNNVNGAVITVSGGTVLALGGSLAAGVGGGDAADGGAVTISGGVVEASGGYTAIGGGQGASGFGSLEVGGLLRIPVGAFVIADSDLGNPEVRVLATGRIEGAVGYPTVGATMSGTGQILNDGVITLMPAYVGVTVQNHNYLIDFDAQGGTSTPTPVTVYAPTFSSGLRAFPSDPTRTGFEFAGWFTTPGATGSPVTASSVLSASGTLYAGWVLPMTGSSSAPLIPWALSLILVGVGLVIVKKRFFDSSRGTCLR